MDKKLEQYRDLLLEWNEHVNLTAITDPEEIRIKHFEDSLTCLKTDLFTSGVKVIDVGTGAGFPGLPLAMARPDISVTLLDSLKKRLLFLDEVIRQTDTKNAVTVHARAEDGGRDKKLREQFDIVVSRAVSRLSVLCEYTLPYLKVGGTLIAMKGPSAEEELAEAKNAISVLGGGTVTLQKTALEDESLSHCLVLIKKVRPTPTTYPRKAGTPTKNPL
ncbi:MAG: 16S rRNA (guanine(527)-N(7))-methyltransferase RsmG [Clostridia bacterium]|nr:16S rRNA (guanine(527)-N(7))-methyltransferase RsmG [Clostridia bacterium]